MHYYEDGNVRLITSKKLDLKVGSDASAAEVVKAIAVAERKYQEELNRGFAGLSEGAFKGLRRQLPVTRQKVEWEKVGSYRVGYVSSGKSNLLKLTNLTAKILVVVGRGKREVRTAVCSIQCSCCGGSSPIIDGYR